MGRRNRPSSIDINRTPLLRAELAHTAARLMVENGITDFQLAKKKACRQLNLPDAQPLPSNEEVQAALRDYQALFVGDEHAEHLRFLRQTAVDLMHLLHSFQPYLTGPVLDGTAGEYSAVDLLLYADSAKEVEIFLLNEDLNFQHGTPKDDRVEAIFILNDFDTGITANLFVLPREQERFALKSHDGKGKPRARATVVERLIGTSGVIAAL